MNPADACWDDRLRTHFLRTALPLAECVAAVRCSQEGLIIPLISAGTILILVIPASEMIPSARTGCVLRIISFYKPRTAESFATALIAFDVIHFLPTEHDSLSVSVYILKLVIS